MSKKKVLFFSLFKIDTIQSQGIYPDLLGEFEETKFDIYILSSSERGQKIISEKIIENNVTIIQVRTLKAQKTNGLEKLLSSLSLEFLLMRAYNKHLKGILFDLVLFPTPTIFYTNFLRKIKLTTVGIKYLLLKDIFPQNAIDLKFFNSNSFFARYFKKVELKLYDSVDFIGCMSEANKSYLVNKRFVDQNKIEVNPNTININKYPVLEKNIFRKKENIFDDDLLFVYGGNLGKPQGIPKIMKIAKYIENFPFIHFIICGNGTEVKKLRNAILKDGLRQTKIFSSLTKNEYLQIVNESNLGMVFLDDSFSIPNYPSRILDYMNYELPVFSWTDSVSDIGDIFVLNNAGYSFKSKNDYEKIKSLIKNLKIQELETMGIVSKKLLVEKFQTSYSYQLIKDKL